MVPHMRVHGRRTWPRAWADLSTAMAMSILASGPITWQMVLAPTTTKEARQVVAQPPIGAIGATISRKVVVQNRGLKGLNFKARSHMAEKMARDVTDGLMALSTKAHGLIKSSMAQVSTSQEMAAASKGNGSSL